MGRKISKVIFLTWVLLASFLPEYYCQNCQSQECLNLLDLRVKKQQDRQDNLLKLKQEYPISEKSVQITDLPLDQLKAKLQTRELKARDVLSAYLANAINATTAFNCITEFSPAAITLADKLDASPVVKGPLHGIPFCVSDNHNIKGMVSTLGYSKNLYQPAKDTAAYIKALEDLGAVPFWAVKFATGTDMGGCVRISAHFNGISGIKPTEGRLSLKGVVSPIPKVVGLQPTTGFLADDPKTIAFVMQSLLENNVQSSHDTSSVLPIPWNSSLLESNKPLRIGYVNSYPIFPALGQTEATLLKAKEALELRGHNLTAIEMIDSYESFDVFTDLLLADNGESIKQQLRNDEVSNAFEAFRFVLRLPHLAKRIISFLPVPDRTKMVLTPGTAARISNRLWDKVKTKRELREDILNFMDRHSIDVIISPAFPFPAPKVETAPYLLLGYSYTSIWNLVEFPAGVVKFGLENGTDVTDYNDEGDPVLRVAKHNYPASTGMPIGVQVIGRPFQDELVLRIMSELYSSK
ncbi:unnamed protein product [Allacma fusca]|uniref:Amidase domain-containing protein n=1 Tax=Allacma fusca TaxID=39272 RepID=A0A8J2PJ84_9HEXA|nr:unnamed protein product [Allacma fusca]